MAYLLKVAGIFLGKVVKSYRCLVAKLDGASPVVYGCTRLSKRQTRLGSIPGQGTFGPWVWWYSMSVYEAEGDRFDSYRGCYGLVSTSKRQYCFLRRTIGVVQRILIGK